MPFTTPSQLVAPYLRPYGQTAVNLAPTFLADKRAREQLIANQPYRDIAVKNAERIQQDIDAAKEAQKLWADLMGNAGLSSGLSPLLPQGITPEQALRYRKMGIIGQVPVPSQTTAMPYASSPLGIFSKETGEVTHPAPKDVSKFDLIKTVRNGQPVYEYVPKGAEGTWPVAPTGKTEPSQADAIKQLVTINYQRATLEKSNTLTDAIAQMLISNGVAVDPSSVNKPISPDYKKALLEMYDRAIDYYNQFAPAMGDIGGPTPPPPTPQLFVPPLSPAHGATSPIPMKKPEAKTQPSQFLNRPQTDAEYNALPSGNLNYAEICRDTSYSK
jgi:hypothetical protein